MLGEYALGLFLQPLYHKLWDMLSQATSLRRRFLLLSLIALCLTVCWSVSVYLRESKHAGEPLPILTLAQLAGPPQTTLGYVHLQGAVPDFTRMMVEDHFCHRIECKDHFMPLYDATHPGTPRVAVLSLIRTFPGDVNEARHPLDLRDPVIEGEVDPDGLFPSQIQSLRARDLLVDDRTVVFKRRALQGRVPPADSVDVLVPWLVGLPVALVMGLVAFAGLRNGRQKLL